MTIGLLLRITEKEELRDFCEVGDNTRYQIPVYLNEISYTCGLAEHRHIALALFKEVARRQSDKQAAEMSFPRHEREKG